MDLAPEMLDLKLSKMQLSVSEFFPVDVKHPHLSNSILEFVTLS